ncbi:hypothetical protein BCR41DRAFT_203325 [Lobosporangium transversale]|uniref:Uncharacterized protein n=1 Tax=Lobosporangium transversale TaxID=64571 RepID=A0A1Y2GXZ7_9FUNG|nr:hypothetical protein BCR41DRAFT_203325 [Lobosporangium transversale]ORZ26641.1 hypothetical protein BCR41DRAFT_203325 [Lobosporangium transversale]|eukprot:XP_021884404.1 hypothetical protein BCR41DRAFT_203325 [Lobosporangium transversale]
MGEGGSMCYPKKNKVKADTLFHLSFHALSHLHSSFASRYPLSLFLFRLCFSPLPFFTSVALFLIPLFLSYFYLSISILLLSSSPYPRFFLCCSSLALLIHIFSSLWQEHPLILISLYFISFYPSLSFLVLLCPSLPFLALPCPSLFVTFLVDLIS